MTRLSSLDRKKLETNENIIEKGWTTFVEVGQSLGAIKEDRLYREQFPTFDAYCRHRWSYRRSYAYELVGAAQVVKCLSAIPDIPLPTNESQVRPLIGLEPEQVCQAWTNAVKKAKSKRITARLVKKSASAFKSKEGGLPKRSGPATSKRWSVKNVRQMVKLLELIEEQLKHGDTDSGLKNLERVRRMLDCSSPPKRKGKQNR